MAKKPDAEGVQVTTRNTARSALAVPMMTVVEGDKRPSEDLMKLPKAQIVRNIVVPVNKTRFIVDVDNQSKQGKRIIALMESLRDGNLAVTKTVAEILGALAGMVAENPNSQK